MCFWGVTLRMITRQARRYPHCCTPLCSSLLALACLVCLCPVQCSAACTQSVGEDSPAGENCLEFVFKSQLPLVCLHAVKRRTLSGIAQGMWANRPSRSDFLVESRPCDAWIRGAQLPHVYGGAHTEDFQGSESMYVFRSNHSVFTCVHTLL